MALKILLVSLNTFDSPYPVFPLGVCQMASALQNAGHTVEVYDLNIDNDGLEDKIREFDPNYAGISLRNIDDVRMDTGTFFAPSLANATSRIRKVKDIPVIAGGSGFSLFPNQLLEFSKADYGVKGEGEITFIKFLECMENNESVTDIPGLVFRDGDKVITNPMEGFSGRETVIPIRPKKLVDYYLEKSSMLNIQTQRGCAFKCCYCTYPTIEGRKFRRRPEENVCDDIEAGVKAGGKYFFVVDSVFNTSPDHVAKICEEIIKRKLNIEWGCFLKPRGLTSDLMSLMARAGLTHIEFGSDSFSDPVLDAYGKGFHFKDILESSELARINKIHYAHFLLLGGPGETEETIIDGYNNSKNLKKTVIFPFAGMRIYPNTPLYDVALKEGVINESTDLLPPAYYLSSKVSRKRIDELLQSFAESSRNWIIGDTPPELIKVMDGLRRNGVRGPLWEFLAR